MFRAGDIKMFGLRLPRLATLLIAGAFLLVAALLAALYLWSPRATLRITTGPEGGGAQRFISALVSVSAVLHPHIHFETVTVPSLEASAKALEDGKADIAVVRTDIQPPANGQTLIILRRDVIALIVPGESHVKDIPALTGKTVAIPAGPLQEYNSRALNKILAYYNIAPAAVKREVLPLPEIGPALHDRRAAAALAVGPAGPGEVVNLVAAIAKSSKKAPVILPIDEADAVAKRFPEFEPADVPEGAFKGHPPVPSDTVKSVAVTYRFAVPLSMLNVVAGAIARSILKAKAKLMAMTPAASQIEAPDTDSENPLLPVHPGVAAYLTSGDQSFFDEFQQYFYYVGIPLSILASFSALIAGFFRNRRLEADQQQIFRLLVIADEAMKADLPGLSALEMEFPAIVATCVNKLATESGAADQAPVSLAIEHARRSIEGRKAVLLGSGAAPKAAAGDAFWREADAAGEAQPSPERLTGPAN
ncbi:MAG TPA: TAXI family TRAP transporter solute-binding subunit [Methylocella sp.]|nr:TAXI family TRAP transporter solute-binding subunit [Methylocella sp.]